MRIPVLWIAITSLVSITSACPLVAAEEHNPVAREPRGVNDSATLGIILKLRKSGPHLFKQGSASDRMSTLGKRAGVSLSLKREISDALVASTVELRGEAPDQVLQRLRADEAVEYATLDYRRYPHATQPNDSLFSGQWYLRNSEVSAVNAIDAWDVEQGRPGIVVAVIDTGVLYDHPDLGRGDRGGKLLPGYDFVSSDHMVNDGNGRDNDPSDPGDWIDSNDKNNTLFGNCDIASSSWHGTRVAGMVGATTNNTTGVAGLSWNSYILPVRVLGKCGGVDSDILAGLRWAGGLSVPGVPANPTPARVLNASFGSQTACQPAYRDVIEELAARKVLMVISAGNEGTVVSSPANCPGVASVAAIRHAGSKVGFSSLGPEVTLAAPGGNCVNINGGPCLFSLDTTSNSGTAAPAGHIYTNQIQSNLGTSFSAPIVSGIAALMLSRNANLSTAQVLARLREGARPFPTSVPDDPTVPVCRIPANDQDFQLVQCLCTTSTCGAGMANAANSVAAADRPIAAMALPVTVSAGQDASFNAGGSTAACGRTLVAYSWTIASPGSNPPTIQGANTSVAVVTAPATGAFTMRLTVTDNLGRTDSADVLVESSRASSAAPANAGTLACAAAIVSGPTPGSAGSGSSSGSGASSSGGGSASGGGNGGGGGSFDLQSLLGLLLVGLLGVARRRPEIRRCIC